LSLTQFDNFLLDIGVAQYLGIQIRPNKSVRLVTFTGTIPKIGFNAFKRQMPPNCCTKAVQSISEDKKTLSIGIIPQGKNGKMFQVTLW
jgi:hypothetical protein